MRAENYIPPNVIPKPLRKMAPLLKKRWLRKLILLPSTISGKRFSNKTEDYGVFKPSMISNLDQISLYVRDIEKSRKWYEDLAGMTHSRTCEKEPHPIKEGFQIKCCYMNAKDHEECVVFIEEYDLEGNVIIPSGMSFFHFALEVEGNSMEDVFAFAEQANSRGFEQNYGPVRHNDSIPHGDGETGGNVAVYFYDPDYNNVEFCGGMDTIDNYKERAKQMKK
tara:strand:+ start:344 stop:1009 length:666 start_codon:yes stop_codon:yes gene_type:complete